MKTGNCSDILNAKKALVDIASILKKMSKSMVEVICFIFLLCFLSNVGLGNVFSFFSGLYVSIPMCFILLMLCLAFSVTGDVFEEQLKHLDKVDLGYQEFEEDQIEFASSLTWTIFSVPFVVGMGFILCNGIQELFVAENNFALTSLVKLRLCWVIYEIFKKRGELERSVDIYEESLISFSKGD